jgi:hypothetical protein
LPLAVFSRNQSPGLNALGSFDHGREAVYQIASLPVCRCSDSLLGQKNQPLSARIAISLKFVE